MIDIIIPIFNEEEALPGFYAQLQRLPFPFHPIFIDNGSMDKSLEFIRTIAGATVICHEKNRGYGASLRAGIKQAGTEKIIIIDADGEYSPNVIPAIVAELDRFEVVHTSRFIKRENVQMHPVKGFGNRIVTMIFNILFQQSLTDLYTGCKGYRLQSVKDLPLERSGFEHVLEISARLVRNSIGIKEVPVHYKQRKSGKSKMNHFFETLKFTFFVVYYYFTLKRKQARDRL